MKVFIVGGDILIEKMFAKRQGYELVENAGDAGLLCFTGGADVFPGYYNEAVHKTTRYNADRDEREAYVFNTYKGKKMMVGICRGSQFLNVMCGGSLWQDVDKHAIGGTHICYYMPEGKYDYNIDVDDGNPNEDNAEPYQVTSTHHQMMRPDKARSELWGFAFKSRHRDRGNQQGRASDFQYSPDVEIVFYPEEKVLGFQPHPEYGVKSCEDLFFRCLDRAFA